MRIIVNDKFGEDQIVHVKNKEKNIALFNEVVRLGQESEKKNEEFLLMGQATDAKINALEARVIKAEQEIMGSQTAGGSNFEAVATLSERMEKRIGQLETALQLMTVYFSQ